MSIWEHLCPKSMTPVPVMVDGAMPSTVVTVFSEPRAVPAANVLRATSASASPGPPAPVAVLVAWPAPPSAPPLPLGLLQPASGDRQDAEPVPHTHLDPPIPQLRGFRGAR